MTRESAAFSRRNMQEITTAIPAEVDLSRRSFAAKKLPQLFSAPWYCQSLGQVALFPGDFFFDLSGFLKRPPTIEVGSLMGEQGEPVGGWCQDLASFVALCYDKRNSIQTHA
jgi:hypothetical protein